MDSHIFFNSFRFNEFRFEKYHHTDNRRGSPQHFLGFMKTGTCRITSAQGTLNISEGDVFYIPKDLSYQSYWYGKSHICFFSYGFDFFPDTAQKSYVLQCVPCSEDLKNSVCAIPRGIQAADCLTLGRFFSVLALLLPLMKTRPADSREDLYREIRNRIFDNPHALTGEIARLCGVSETTVYSVCKAAANTTPGAVRRECLAQKATVLLTSTGIPVQEISDRLGFSSASYFRKVLKAQTGKTPREIRKNALLV